MSRSRTSSRSDGMGIRPGKSGKRWLVSWLVVALSGASVSLTPIGLAGGPAPQQQPMGDLGPGCATDRPAISHHAGGAKADPGNKTAPVPCISKPGYRTGEVSIAVTNSGNILFRPAWDPQISGPSGGIIRSADRSASWDAPNSSANDNNMWVDRTTGRAFWIAGAGRLEISDDDGRTWYPGGRVLNFDHRQIFGGPATANLKNQLHGYPNVVYACVGHYPYKCQKSLDGGMTWGPELDVPYPREVASIQGPAHDCSAFGMQGVVDKDGTVYVPYTPCNRPYVAISHDEGGSWQTVEVGNTDLFGVGNLSLGIDAQDNLYAAWIVTSDRMPYLATSRDHGMHWGTPLMIGAPGINEAALAQLVAGASGQVAVAYYGSKNATIPFPANCFPITPGPRNRAATPAAAPQARAPVPTPSCPGSENELWDTYVTESWNALDAQPLFWSAAMNAPSEPTWYGCSPMYTGVTRWDENFTAGPGFTRGCYPGLTLDYFGAAMSPDNTPWIGFAQACPIGKTLPGSPNANCPSPASGQGGLFALIGRLVARE